jgi:hypothetical protein
MSGARSRNRGKTWEQECARLMAEVTGLDVVTGRSLGLTYGPDLVTVTDRDQQGRALGFSPDVAGWAIEAKAVKVRNPKAWLRQAEGQRLAIHVPVVLWKRPRKKFEEGSAFLLDETAPRGWVETTIGEWIDRRLTTGEAA